MPIKLPKLTHREQKIAGGLLATVIVVTVVASFLFRGTPAAPIASFAQCAQAGFVVSDTNPPACSDGHRSFVGPAAPVKSLAPGTTLPFELMVEGDSGGNYPAGQQVISSQSAWQHYWVQVHSGLRSIPPILPVDFNTSDIIALSSGREVTNGYNLKVTAVMGSATGTAVDVTFTIPTISCKVANTSSNRYFIAKTQKLTQPVSFRITTEYHKCN